MKLILKYYGGDADGRFSWVVLPVEAESLDDARAGFLAALEQAMAQSATSFECWGTRHHVYNFMSEAEPRRVACLQREAELRGQRLPLDVVQQNGQCYWFRLPTFLTLDEWSDQARTEASQGA